MAEPILTVDHLVKSYDGKTNVLDNVSFAVKPGEVIVVVGPSGCGKSTLLRCLNGLEPVQAGRVKLGSETVAYGGKNLAALRQRIGMVFQSYELFPHLTVLENILLAPTKVRNTPGLRCSRKPRPCWTAWACWPKRTATPGSFRVVRNSVSPLCVRSVCTPRSCCSTK